MERSISPPFLADFLASPHSAAWLLWVQSPVRLPLRHPGPKANGAPRPVNYENISIFPW